MVSLRVPILLLLLFGAAVLPLSAQEGESDIDELPPLPEGAFPSFEKPEDEVGPLAPFQFGFELEAGILGITPQASLLMDFSWALGERMQLSARTGFSYWFPIWDDVHAPYYVPVGVELRFYPLSSAQVLYYIPLDGSFNNILFRVDAGIDHPLRRGPGADFFLTLKLGMGFQYLPDRGETLFPFGIKIGTRMNF